MSAVEFIVVGSALAVAAGFLLRVAWKRWKSSGSACCTGCPVVPGKIRLAAPESRVSNPRR